MKKKSILIPLFALAAIAGGGTLAASTLSVEKPVQVAAEGEITVKITQDDIIMSKTPSANAGNIIYFYLKDDNSIVGGETGNDPRYVAAAGSGTLVVTSKDGTTRDIKALICKDGHKDTFIATKGEAAKEYERYYIQIDAWAGQDPLQIGDKIHLNGNCVSNKGDGNTLVFDDVSLVYTGVGSRKYHFDYIDKIELNSDTVSLKNTSFSTSSTIIYLNKFTPVDFAVSAGWDVYYRIENGTKVTRQNGDVEYFHTSVINNAVGEFELLWTNQSWFNADFYTPQAGDTIEITGSVSDFEDKVSGKYAVRSLTTDLKFTFDGSNLIPVAETKVADYSEKAKFSNGQASGNNEAFYMTVDEYLDDYVAENVWTAQYRGVDDITIEKANGTTDHTSSLIVKTTDNRYCFEFESWYKGVYQFANGDKVMVKSDATYSNSPMNTYKVKFDFTVYYLTAYKSTDPWVGGDEILSFVKNYLKFDTISVEDGSDTGNCLTDWSSVKEAYSALNEKQKEIFVTLDEFADARARLAAWALANNSAFNSESGALDAIKSPMMFATDDESNFGLIGLSAISIIGVGGFFLLRKKRNSK